MNLFRRFDPVVLGVSVNWLRCVLFLMIFINRFWLLKSELIKRISLIINRILNDFKNLLFRRKLLLFLRLFMNIFFINFLGLFPYIFTSSTHLVFGLSLGLPLWIGYILYSFKTQSEYMLAHLVPLGTPVILQPFMVIIELIRNVIRPLTLRIRLIANIIAGHLLLTLLGTIRNLGVRVLILVIVGMILILCLELGVAVIQAYVFTLLSRLYVREIDTVKIRKINS